MKTATSGNREIALALAWEFWTCGWAWIVSAPLLAMVLPGFIFTSLGWQYGADYRGGEIGAQLQFVFYWTALTMTIPSVLAALGKPGHRYTLPASSFLIVASLMACVMTTVFAQYAVIALGLNALFDVGWPVIGPGLLAAVVVAWCLAMLWSTSNSTGLQVLACAASAALLGVAIKVWGPPDRSLMELLSSVGAWHLLAFAVATACCVGVGTFGFGKVRSGAGLDVRSLVDWLRRLVMPPEKSGLAAFSSPARAQLWLEWTERGRALPAGTALLGLVLLIISLFIPAKESSDFAGDFFSLFLRPA